MIAWMLQYGGQIGGLLGAVIAAWTLYNRIKKAAKRVLVEALDDRFATRDDMKRIEDGLTLVADSVQALTYQVSVRLDSDVPPRRAAEG